jgi:LPS-assembly lipoprotein
MYLETHDPYGQLARNLRQALKMSNVKLVATPEEADTILSITHDDTSQTMLSVSGTQLIRQYRLTVTVGFTINNAKGVIILGPQTLAESRVITIQSSLILGSSNEAHTYYQQMRRTLAYAIMNRISSKDVTNIVNAAFATKPKHSKQ